MYDFHRENLIQRIGHFVEEYNAEVNRYERAGSKVNLDDFVRYDKIKWSESLKKNLARGRYAEFNVLHLRTAVYRPFSKRHLYFDNLLVERRYLMPQIFPNAESEQENILLCCTNEAQIEFSVLASKTIPCLHLGGRQGQCFPFYIYDEDGTNRRENITDWALRQFRDHYGAPKIGKWDIFHYVYGLLHHPGYRAKYADNLKRELPRIPFAPPVRDGRGADKASGFWAFVEAGKELARLHLEYETLEPYPLTWIETPDVPLSYRVESKMRLNKEKTSLVVNPSLTLGGIPAEVFQYRLGNRSALEWVIDQYQVSEDKRSGIKSDPNQADDPEYIVRLVGQVVRVSLETVRIVGGLPGECGG